MKRLMLSILGWGMVCATALAQSDTTVTVTRIVPVDASFSYQAARALALEQAMAEAVRVLGVFIESTEGYVVREAADTVQDEYWSMSRGQAVGVVTDYALTEEEAGMQADQPIYTFTFDVTVVPQPLHRPDPAFTLALSLNDDLFYDRSGEAEGDEVVLTVKPSQESYVTLLYQREDSLWVLFPNLIEPENHLSAGEAFQYPSEDLRAEGVRLRVDLPDDREESREFVLALASKRPVPFRCGNTAIREDEMTNTGCSLRALGRWLLAVPRNERAVAVSAYRVRRATTDTPSYNP